MSRFQTILGVGAALMDYLVSVPDSFVAETGSAKGGMTLVEPGVVTGLRRRIPHHPEFFGEAPGGAACNTLVGLARLGSKAAFLGKRGDDELGENLEMALRGTGLDVRLLKGTGDTGCVMSLVTPDAQRTMFTALGASAEMGPADLGGLDLRGVGLLYLEGYLLFNAPLFTAILDLAKREKIPVALDCGSFNVIELCRGLFDQALESGCVEILLANEEEARALTGREDVAALEWIAERVPVAVVKIGRRGALLAERSRMVRVDAEPAARVLDTTGAGDSWAAGFLHALDLGLPLETAGRTGAIVACEVVQVLGAQLPEGSWDLVRARLRSEG